MKHSAKIVFLFVLIIFLYSCDKKNTTKIEIIDLDNWEFEYKDENYPAKAPGNIHTDLFKNNLIPNLFYGDNELELQWIGEEVWTYKTKFTINKNCLNKNIDLVFEGLDTRTEIKLNGQHIANTDNMFIQHKFDVKKLIKEGENILEIKFSPVGEYNQKMAEQLDYELPDIRVFSRKAPYQLGWDWGPNYATAGIWKPAYIRVWDDFYIENFSVVSDEINEETAYLSSKVKITSNVEQNADIQVVLDDNQVLYSENIKLNKGNNNIEINFSLNNPKLWHCNGRGEQNLYNFRLKLQTKNTCDSANCVTGIRQVNLISEIDSIGQSFYFNLNGKDIFAKGANWIPMESFPGNLSRNKYRNILNMAKDAGYNMLRVWGGGYYEDDAFYEICDSLGIMVWQDFMFACAVYPNNHDFFNNVEQEVFYQTERLRHHPSIVLWCGNNEVSNGWFDWGWQKQFNYSAIDSTEIWNANKYIFEDLIPKTLKQIDKNAYYWPSSPMYGWGHPENNTHGDAHYWGVWWGKQDFEVYFEKTGRFMSEYGYQSMPALKTLQTIADTNNLSISNPEIKNHQKHPYGFENIDDALEKYLGKENSFEKYIYLSQIAQATAMQIAFDAHFSAAPHCMGSLFWQFNDCWPSISWSAVDYYLQAKALHYTTKRMFAPINLYYRPDNDIIKFYVFSDDENIENLKASAEIFDFSGKLINRSDVKTSISANKANIINFSYIDLYKNLKPREHFAKVSIYNKDSLICSRAFYFERDKNLKLPQTEITVNKSIVEDKIQVVLFSDKLVKHIALDADGVSFSDNYFDILPGEVKTVFGSFPKGENLEEIDLNFMFYNALRKE